MTVGVDKKRICLAEGEGRVHQLRRAPCGGIAAEGPSALRSGVFHPRLVGGMDTIYWQKLIRPLLQPGVPSYFLLSKGEPWQAEVLARLWEAWHAVDEEPDDYENRVRYLLRRRCTPSRPTARWASAAAPGRSRWRPSA